jgi:hypothetical protein
LLDGMPVHFYHYVKWFFDSLPTLMDRTKWNGFVASVITESYSCNLLPGDLYEQLQKHEVQNELKVLIGRNFRILPIPPYKAFSLTLSLF